MKRILTFFALAAMMMPVSCIKDDLAGPEMGNGSGKGMKFTAVMEVPGSKTAIDEDGSVAWVAGDQIKFDYEIGKEDSDPVISDELETIEDGAAVFYADVPNAFGMTEAEYRESLEEGATNSRHMYVSYPASVETAYAFSEYHVTIPAVQDGSFENASISLAKWNPNAPKDPLTFYNLCGLLQVDVDDPNVRSIRLTSATDIAGELNVGFEEFSYEIPGLVKIKNVVKGKGETAITVNVDGPGTYYIAVRPDVEILDFCVALLDENNNFLGDRAALTQTKLSVERAHVLPLGTLGTGSFVTANDGDYFVTPDGRGTGDGSSWANAASYTTFVKEANVHGGTSSGKIKNVYMSEGDYIVTAQSRFDIDNDDKIGIEGFNGFNIWGGYSKESICCDLTRRDIIKYPTNIVGSGEGHRLWNIYSGVWGVDGITFKDFVGTTGGVLNITDVATVNIKDCNFINNTSTSGNAGAVLFTTVASATASTFEGCSFVGNKTTATTASNGSGGAVASTGTAKKAVVKFTKCLFKDNNAGYAGGALWARSVSYHVEDCNFIDNKSAKGGDALYVDRNNGVAIYCDRSYFSSSTGTMTVICVGNIDASTTSSNASVYLNNCVVAGNWGVSGSQIKNLSVGKIVIVNTTLSTQSSTGVLENTDNGSVSVINSIVANTTSSSNGLAFANAKETASFKVGYSLYTRYNASGITENNSLGGLWLRDGDSKNFPTGNDVWYPKSGNASTMKANNNTSKTSVDDVRGYVYYYKWNGESPTIDENQFTNATLTEVTALVNAADANFATWLGDRLGKDIRGNARNATSMWPGSYQE